MTWHIFMVSINKMYNVQHFVCWPCQRSRQRWQSFKVLINFSNEVEKKDKHSFVLRVKNVQNELRIYVSWSFVSLQVISFNNIWIKMSVHVSMFNFRKMILKYLTRAKIFHLSKYFSPHDNFMPNISCWITRKWKITILQRNFFIIFIL